MMKYFSMLGLLFLGNFAVAGTFQMPNSLPKDETAELKFGVGVNYKTATYKADNSVSVVPLAFYDDNVWYIEGSEAGFYPYKDNKNHLRVGLTYDSRSFDPSDADGNLQLLDKRKSSALAHASYMYVSKFGGIRTKVATDILGKHKGRAATLSYIARFNVENATIYPSFGVNWQDKKYNDYYYGIDGDESLRSGVASYTAKAGVSPFISVTANYDLNDQITLFGNGRVDWLSDNQKDSSMADKEVGSSVIVGVMYRFK